MILVGNYFIDGNGYIFSKLSHKLLISTIGGDSDTIYFATIDCENGSYPIFRVYSIHSVHI
ncbi:MAG: hypothetical protein B6U89_03720 [Desulfurococcales archaeon ex4484_58]|nr:MAG: hypothetical protein B6U89_03720 [Desulfurococcales archaeon ex4484_58]